MIICNNLKIGKDLVHVGSGSSMCLEQRTREKVERDEAGEVSDGQVDQEPWCLVVELKFLWF